MLNEMFHAKKLSGYKGTKSVGIIILVVLRILGLPGQAELRLLVNDY